MNRRFFPPLQGTPPVFIFTTSVPFIPECGESIPNIFFLGRFFREAGPVISFHSIHEFQHLILISLKRNPFNCTRHRFKFDDISIMTHSPIGAIRIAVQLNALQGTVTGVHIEAVIGKHLISIYIQFDVIFCQSSQQEQTGGTDRTVIFQHFISNDGPHMPMQALVGGIVPPIVPDPPITGGFDLKQGTALPL